MALCGVFPIWNLKLLSAGKEGFFLPPEDWYGFVLCWKAKSCPDEKVHSLLWRSSVGSSKPDCTSQQFVSCLWQLKGVAVGSCPAPVSSCLPVWTFLGTQPWNQVFCFWFNSNYSKFLCMSCWDSCGLQVPFPNTGLTPPAQGCPSLPAHVMCKPFTLASGSSRSSCPLGDELVFCPFLGTIFFNLLALCWLSIKPTFSLNIQQIMCYEEPGILRVSVYAELRSHLWTLESSLYFYGSHSPLSLHSNRGLWHKHWQGWGGAGIPPGMDLSL